MQVFPKSANYWSRGSIIAGLFVVASLVWMVLTLQRSDFVTSANQFIEQPVQFSHQHHVGGIGIDCRYCHTSVEVAASAGIPPTKTCINCHSQIWSTSPYLEPVRASFREDKPLQWIRVHDLPDFVYFNHSAHLNAGIGCATCHGRVDRMPITWKEEPLYMKWCLDCHRDPSQFIRPRDKITDMAFDPKSLDDHQRAELVKLHGVDHANLRLTNCAICHR